MISYKHINNDLGLTSFIDNCFIRFVIEHFDQLFHYDKY